MIIHTTENGQRVSYSTAESSEVKDGFIHFYDVHGTEVGRQLVPVAPLLGKQEPVIEEIPDSDEPASSLLKKVLGVK